MNSVVHFEIPASNTQRAKKFYADIFSWKTVDMPEMDYIILHTAKTDKKGMTKEKGVINGGMMKRSKILKAPVVTISVKDINNTLASIRKNKGSQVMKKTSIGDMGFIAYFKDSEGNIMGLWQGK